MKPSRNLTLGLALSGVVALSAAAFAEEVIAVTTDHRVIRFDTENPGVLTGNKNINGIAGNVVAIDVRSADGTLYAMTDAGRLYRLDAQTGDARAVGSGPFTNSVGILVGMDFDPAQDVLRVVTEQNRNFRVDPDSATIVDAAAGAGVQEDSELAYNPADPRFPADPTVTAIAFDNNVPNAGSTTLYGLDTTLDTLVRIDAPSNGQLSTIGSLGVNTSAIAGFDISRLTGNAYAVLTLAGQSRSGLYNVSLAGGATFAGPIADNVTIRSMTLGPSVAPPQATSRNLVGLSASGEILRFTDTTPGTIATRLAVTGLVGGDTLVGIDTRPTNGRLYGLGSGGRIYVINTSTGLATPIRQTPFELPLAGTAFAFDFNTFGNRVRIVSDTGQSFRVHPDTGAVVDGDPDTDGVQGDTALSFGAGDVNEGASPRVSAIAFDRNDSASNTTLFGIDTNLDVLVRQGSIGGTPDSQNGGRLRTIGALGIDVTHVAGFEIVSEGTALATLSAPGGSTRLYSIDLDTGEATLVGDVGTGESLRDVAAAPTSNPPLPGDDLDVRSALLRFDYRRDNRDSVTIEGRLPFPSSPFAGQVVTVDLGGYTDAFFLTGAGRAKNDETTRGRKDDDRFQFVGRPSEGTIRFSLTLRREDLSDELADEGMGGTETVTKSPRTLPLTITVDGATYSTTIPLNFTAKAGKTGVAKRPRD